MIIVDKAPDDRGRCYDELGRRSAEYIFQQYHDDLKISCSSVVSERPSVVSMPNVE